MSALVTEPEEWVYRAARPETLAMPSGHITTATYALKEHDVGLSVYSAGIQTPRGVLQKQLESRFEILAGISGKKRIDYERWLDRKGRTVEDLIRLGWRVVRISLSSFRDRGFQIGEVEPDGHIEIYGPRDQFLIYAYDWALESEEVPVE